MSETGQRTLGLFQATGVGVGAIVGGGIFVLAGVAFDSAGPSAMIAFAVNGGVAFLTAMSFAEISSAFPENGGAYTLAKKVMSVRAAFAVGWILWFAYIVAGVLYALGFAAFAALAVQATWEALGSSPPSWLFGRRFLLFLSSAATVFYAWSLVRKTGGGGQIATVGKVVVFAVLVVAGAVAFVGQPIATSSGNISPFFSGGASGLVMAMGFTFIALQGFDLIAAVAGEVKEPGRTIPRAMFLSLACALIIYLPLLFLVAAVGVEPGQHIADLARDQPENLIPIAGRRFLGATGYWLVLVAALLSTLSALHANLLAASRVALAMGQDHTLPTVFGDLHVERRTPVVAVYASALTLIAIIFMVPDLAAAGAAASLIFLLVFFLAHLTTYLARRRGGTDEAPYRTPWFPAVPVVGGCACAGLAVFQAVVVPDAGAVVLIWLGLGTILYWSLFARRAELVDASAEAFDPGLVGLRGQRPLVLVPIANPAHAPAMVGVANALAPDRVGKVLLLSIVPIEADLPSGAIPPAHDDVQQVVRDALRQSYTTGYRPEALITAAVDPLAEIARITLAHQCGTVLLGLSGVAAAVSDAALETLINKVAADVAIMRAPESWLFESTRRVLVPLGGRGEQHELRARLIGSICRHGERQVTFVSVLPQDATDALVEKTRRSIEDIADLKMRGRAEVQIVRSDDALSALVAESKNYDLMIVGLQSGDWRRTVLGDFTLGLARRAACATLLLASRRPRTFDFLKPIHAGVVDAVRRWGPPPPPAGPGSSAGPAARRA